MQLATTATGPRDKSSWPRIQALPSALPSPAPASPARHELWARFSAGSFAGSRDAAAQRVSPTWDFARSNPARDAVQYVGRDPRAALAAAAARATALHAQPGSTDGSVRQVRTLVGLYRAGGSWLTVPVWFTPGTNDWQRFEPLAAAEDARFSFRDDRLAAVVGADAFIANPAFAAAFAAR